MLLIKPPSSLETYNDLNNELVNFFRVLRDDPQELADRISLTPWSRSEFEFCCFQLPVEDRIEMARRLYVKLWFSYPSTLIPCKGNFRRHKNGTRSVIQEIRPQSLFDSSKRFLSVVIENRNAFQLMLDLDSPDTLFYLDPPYVFSTRSKYRAYTHEMDDDLQQKFADVVLKLKGFVVISGYPSQLYCQLFESNGWRRVERLANTMEHTKKVEALWLSPNIKTCSTIEK